MSFLRMSYSKKKALNVIKTTRIFKLKCLICLIYLAVNSFEKLKKCVPRNDFIESHT